MPYARSYLLIILLGLPVTFLYNWCAAALQAAGDTKTPLCTLLIAMSLNTVLDLLFVVGFHRGTEGTAAVTVIAQGTASVICLCIMRKKHREFFFDRSVVGWDTWLVKRTAKFGLVSALHQSSQYKGLTVMLALAVCLSILMAAVTRNAVILLMGNPSEEVLQNADAYMMVISLVYVFCFTGSTFVGYFRGIGRVEVPVIGSILQISIRVILSYAWIQTLGLKAVALATGIGWMAIVAYQSVTYWRTVKSGR